jgi:hypothetical protein
MDAVYTPIRSDGLAGATVVSGKRVLVKPVPRARSAKVLAKGGRMSAGQLLLCSVKCTPGADLSFQWSRGDGKRWKAVEGATMVECEPGEGDVGYCMQCSVAARKDNWA